MSFYNENQHPTTISVEVSKHKDIGSYIPLKEEQATQRAVSMAHCMYFHVITEHNDELYSTSDMYKNEKRKELESFHNCTFKNPCRRKPSIITIKL